MIIVYKAVLKVFKLEEIFYIEYFIQVDQELTQFIINSSIKVNIINLSFIIKLEFQILIIIVGAQKINYYKLYIFGIVIVFFLIKNQKERYGLFKKIFYQLILIGILF